MSVDYDVWCSATDAQRQAWKKTATGDESSHIYDLDLRRRYETDEYFVDVGAGAKVQHWPARPDHAYETLFVLCRLSPAQSPIAMFIGAWVAGDRQLELEWKITTETHPVHGGTPLLDIWLSQVPHRLDPPSQGWTLRFAFAAQVVHFPLNGAYGGGQTTSFGGGPRKVPS